jgi:enoyl-CoA hydratase
MFSKFILRFTRNQIGHISCVIFTLSLRAGGSQRLAKIIGPAKAKELIFTGRIIDSQEAHNIGLVNGIYPNVESQSIKIAEEICRNGILGVKASKQLINFSVENNM